MQFFLSVLGRFWRIAYMSHDWIESKTPGEQPGVDARTRRGLEWISSRWRLAAPPSHQIFFSAILCNGLAYKRRSNSRHALAKFKPRFSGLNGAQNRGGGSFLMGKHMLDRDMVESYRNMKTEDKKGFYRWIVANMVVGATLLTLIAAVSIYSNVQPAEQSLIQHAEAK